MSCKVLGTGRMAVTNPYSAGSHNGIDLTDKDEKGVHLLCDIVAHSNGVVVAVRKDCRGFEAGGSYGNYVKLKHDNGYATVYAHMEFGTVKVKVGDTVKAGQKLGYMGNTGTSYGGHLHFEVWKDGVRIDPTYYVEHDFPKAEDIKVGDTVKVRQGALVYGENYGFRQDVYEITHTVLEIYGDRAVIYNASVNVNPVNINDLAKVDDYLKVGDSVTVNSNIDVFGTYLDTAYLSQAPLVVSKIDGNRVYIKNADKGWLECIMYQQNVRKK